MQLFKLILVFAGVVAAAAFAQTALAEIDEDAAVSLAKKGHCFKCHAIDKRKKAPSYKEIARKYSGKPNAVEDLYLHITGTPVVKLEDGDEPHAGPPTKDRKELDNLILWILSRDKAS
jgi:cytochrome c